MNAKGNVKAPKKKRKYSFLLLIGLILLVGYIAIVIVNDRMTISQRQKEKAALQAQLEQQTNENAELQAFADSENKEDYMKKKARDQGYVEPGEKVYYNVTPNE